MATPAMIDGPRVTPASGAATSLVIFLHGYGSNGDDLIGLAPYWRAALPGTAFVAPNAPERCPGAPGGYQWWGIANLDRTALGAGASRAAPALNAFIDEELEHHGIGEDRLALVGFSQGTMMALQVGPQRPRPPAGIVGYSGMLASEASLEVKTGVRPPVLLVHGDSDPMVPLAAFHRTCDALTRHGFPLETHVSPGLGHSIDPAGLALGERFLKRLLS